MISEGVPDTGGIEPADFLAGVKEACEQGAKLGQSPGTIHSFRDLMMPALHRVGAVTERTRALFEAEGIPLWDDAGVLQTLEDDDTGEIRLH